jgi:hypothetical protein
LRQDNVATELESFFERVGVAANDRPRARHVLRVLLRNELLGVRIPSDY